MWAMDNDYNVKGVNIWNSYYDALNNYELSNLV